jgi:hypothetical protein
VRTSQSRLVGIERRSSLSAASLKGGNGSVDEFPVKKTASSNARNVVTSDTE